MGIAMRLPAGGGKTKEIVETQNTMPGTLTVTFQENARVVIVAVSCGAYEGNYISQSSSSAGIVPLVSAGVYTNQPFGRYGYSYYVGYGCNVKKGTNVVLTRLQQGGTLTIRYIN